MSSSGATKNLSIQSLQNEFSDPIQQEPLSVRSYLSSPHKMGNHLYTIDIFYLKILTNG